METSQDNNSFIGTPKSSGQDPIAETSEKKGGGLWKGISLVAVVLIIILGAGCAYFFIRMGEQANKAADSDDKVKTLTTQLNDYKTATNTSNASEIKSSDLDFKVFYDAAAKSISSTTFNLSLIRSSEASSGSFVKNSTDNKYQIAKFNYSDTGGTLTAYFYRTLPSGDWTYSNFSGSGAVLCTNVTAAETAAFAGVLECSKDTIGN